MKDETLKAAYAARAKKGQSAYHVAIAEYMQKPRVEEIPSEDTQDHQHSMSNTNVQISTSRFNESLPIKSDITLPDERKSEQLTIRETAPPEARVIEKVPLTRHLSSTAKQRQQSDKTTVVKQSLKAGKIQKQYRQSPAEVLSTPLPTATRADKPAISQGMTATKHQ